MNEYTLIQGNSRPPWNPEKSPTSPAFHLYYFHLHSMYKQICITASLLQLFLHTKIQFPLVRLGEQSISLPLWKSALPRFCGRLYSPCCGTSPWRSSRTLSRCLMHLSKLLVSWLASYTPRRMENCSNYRLSMKLNYDKMIRYSKQLLIQKTELYMVIKLRSLFRKHSDVLVFFSKQSNRFFQFCYFLKTIKIKKKQNIDN